MRGILHGHRNISEDYAEAIVLATERYDAPEPVNIDTGFEISIRELADVVTELTGFRGRIVWDTSKPNGQPRRYLDVSRAQRAFGFRARTTFRERLAWTVGPSLSQSLRSLTIDGMAVIQAIREKVGAGAFEFSQHATD